MEKVSQRHLFGRNALLWIALKKKEELKDESPVLLLGAQSGIAIWRGPVSVGRACRGLLGLLPAEAGPGCLPAPCTQELSGTSRQKLKLISALLSRLVP